MLWISLEGVFTGGDIAKQMPTEAKKFVKIDKDWTKVMNKAAEMRTVVQCCQNELLKTTLPILFMELEKCQKSLDGYLEQKRAAFPRFYFASNSVLLRILSQGSDLQSVQPYYEKLFDSIDRVVYGSGEKANQIVEIKSIKGRDVETIVLREPLECAGNIEIWLAKLCKEMQKSMKVLCAEGAYCHAFGELRGKVLLAFLYSPSHFALFFFLTCAPHHHTRK